MKGLWLHPKTGKPYYRSRAGGNAVLIPLPDDLPHSHPDFIAAWSEAARTREAPTKAKAGSLASTWASVKAHNAYSGKAVGYRSIIDREARAIIKKGGHVMARAVNEKAVRADLASASNPGARFRAWRMWARVGLESGWLATDPTGNVKKPAEATGSHPAWTLDQIAAFRTRYAIGSTPRAIMELCYWTGARISDVVQLGPRQVGADGILAFTQQKTGKLAYVPWDCALPAYAAHMEPDRLLCKQALSHTGKAFTFLNVNGRARSHKGAGQAIIKACREMELDRSAHGLRKSRAIALAEAGATAPQIAAWTGHRSLSEVTDYIAEMNRRKAVSG